MRGDPNAIPQKGAFKRKQEKQFINSLLKSQILMNSCFLCDIVKIFIFLCDTCKLKMHVFRQQISVFHKCSYVYNVYINIFVNILPSTRIN